MLALGFHNVGEFLLEAREPLSSRRTCHSIIVPTFPRFLYPYDVLPRHATSPSFLSGWRSLETPRALTKFKVRARGIGLRNTSS